MAFVRTHTATGRAEGLGALRAGDPQAFLDLVWHLLILVGVIIAADLLPQPAYADPFSAVFLRVSGAMTGTTGKTIAILAVIALGVGALFGKISWGMALTIAFGVGVVFGAASLVNLLSRGVGNNQGGGGDPIGHAFTVMIGWMNSGAGKALAIIGVVIVGLGALFGKISLPTALVVGSGIAIIFGATSLVTFLSAPAGDIGCAGGGDRFSQGLAGVVGALHNGTARAFATLAVMTLGVAALLGKVSFPMALTLVAGIALVFGVDTIVAALGGGGGGGGGGTGIAGVLCSIVGILTGSAGKSIATIAVVLLGCGAMLGKVSYGAALVVMMGIAVMFGANQIVGIIAPDATGCPGGGAPVLPAAGGGC